MKKILIAGAGIGGCAAALAMVQKGFEVTVLEKLDTIFTEGAGILLYSNALKSLDRLSILPEILETGYSMPGRTEFLDNRSNIIGTVTYKSIDDKYPSYIGINRQRFLDIIYKKAKLLGVEFRFNQKINYCTDTGNKISVTTESGNVIDNCDLLIVADGTNSCIRKQLWKGSESIFSGFGLWHSMHDLHPNVKEKIIVILDDRRFGIIPISDSQMYIWASIKENKKRWITRSDQAKEMYAEFKKVDGFLKDIIEELNDNLYVHYTAVEEVNVNDSWHKNRIVLLGDAAHASLPFMAQGGAMALQDAVTLSNLLSKYMI